MRVSSDSCEQRKPSIQVLKKPKAQKTTRIQSEGHGSFLILLGCTYRNQINLNQERDPKPHTKLHMTWLPFSIPHCHTVFTFKSISITPITPSKSGKIIIKRIIKI